MSFPSSPYFYLQMKFTHFLQGNLNRILSNKSGSQEDETPTYDNVTFETSRSTNNIYQGNFLFPMLMTADMLLPT